MNDFKHIATTDDLNRSLLHADYELALERFIEIAHACDIPSSQISQFGSVSAPGISDLDLLVVAKEQQLQQLYTKFKEAQNQDPAFAYIFYHDPILVPFHLVDEIFNLHTLEGLHPIEKGGSTPEAPKETDHTALHLSWLTFNVHGLHTLLNPKSIPLRLLLLIHKNITQSLVTFENKNGGDKISLTHLNTIRQDILKQTPDSP